MPGAYLWGWDAGNLVWREIVVNDEGKLIIDPTEVTLDKLGDVNAPAPADGEGLIWDDVAGEWVLAALAGGTHAATHEAGGADEIDVTALSGVLADAQVPIGHHTLHEEGNADALADAIAIDAMANLTNTKIWQGDAGNRPVEVGMPETGVVKYAYKTATQTVNNSTVLQDDVHLKFAAEANKTYHVLVWMLLISQNTAHFKFKWSVPAGTWGGWVTSGHIGETTDQSAMTYNAEGFTQTIQGTGGYQVLMFEGIFKIAGTAGTVVLQWAQNTAHASNTQILDRSFLSYAKMN